MTVPTPTKTWQHAENSGPYASLAALMYAWKEQMIGWASGAWSVVSSSDGAGTASAADNWADASDVVFHNAANNHSWLVLQNDNIASGFQICVDCNRNSGGAQTVTRLYVSEGAGFTGGTATDRPTATDEVEPAASAGAGDFEWTAAANLASTPAYLHMAASDDGEQHSWMVAVNSTVPCFFRIGLAENAVDGWTNPWFCVAVTSNYGTAVAQTFTRSFDTDDYCWTRAGGQKAGCYLTSEGYGGGSVGEGWTFSADLDSTGDYPFLPIGLLCLTPVGSRGRLGTVPDLWYGGTVPADGDNFPGDASRTFVQVGCFIHPWDGSTMLLV